MLMMGTSNGYISRNFSGYGSKSYIHPAVPGKEHPAYRLLTMGCTETIVLTEDILSHIKVYNHTTVDTAALLGTNISPELLKYMQRYAYKRVIIWLDDDNAIVRDRQRVLKNRLELMFPEVILITGVGKDPKECTAEEIQRIVDVY